MIARYLFKRDRLTAGFLILIVFGNPAVLQDFITGGDLSVNAIAIFASMLAIVTLAPDRSVAPWKKIGVLPRPGFQVHQLRTRQRLFRWNGRRVDADASSEISNVALKPWLISQSAVLLGATGPRVPRCPRGRDEAPWISRLTIQ